jgi:hypothetical protein
VTVRLELHDRLAGGDDPRNVGGVDGDGLPGHVALLDGKHVAVAALHLLVVGLRGFVGFLDRGRIEAGFGQEPIELRPLAAQPGQGFGDRGALHLDPHRPLGAVSLDRFFRQSLDRDGLASATHLLHLVAQHGGGNDEGEGKNEGAEHGELS